jgi:hypothetical protein
MNGNKRSRQSVALPAGWYWLSDWSYDRTFPLLDTHGWANIQGGNALSSIFSAQKRRRRWIRVRRKRIDHSSISASSSTDNEDYLARAERIYRDSFPGGDLFCSLRSVEENFVLCQNIIKVLLDGIKGMFCISYFSLDDFNDNRKTKAIRLVEKHLADGEALKSAIDKIHPATLSVAPESMNDGESSDEDRSSLPQNPPFDTISTVNEIIGQIPVTQSVIMPPVMWQQDEGTSECPYWYPLHSNSRPARNRFLSFAASIIVDCAED